MTLAIVATITAVAVGGLAQLGAGARSDLLQSARDITSIMRSAQVYATTFNVETAVVYSLDNYQSKRDNFANAPGLSNPIADSITGQPMRVINAAAVMYRLPDEVVRLFTNDTDAFSGFVPVPQREGDFAFLRGDTVMLLEAINDNGGSRTFNGFPTIVYANPSPREFDPDIQRSEVEGEAPDDYSNNASRLGLSTVAVYGGDFDPASTFQNASNPESLREFFLAHRFSPTGRLLTGRPEERVDIHVAFAPNANPDVRVVASDTTALQHELVTVPIELYKSTGRVRVKPF